MTFVQICWSGLVVLNRLTLGKTEEVWHGLAIWKACILISEFVKVGVQKGLKGSWSLRWVISQQSCHEVDCLARGPMTEHLLPRQRFDLREPVFRVFRIHCQNFVSAWCTKDFDNLDELIDATFSGEDGLAEHEFCNDAADGPDIDVGAVV